MKRKKLACDDVVFVLLFFEGPDPYSSAGKTKPPQMGDFTLSLTVEAVEFQNGRNSKLLSDRRGARIWL